MKCIHMIGGIKTIDCFNGGKSFVIDLPYSTVPAVVVEYVALTSTWNKEKLSWIGEIVPTSGILCNLWKLYII